MLNHTLQRITLAKILSRHFSKASKCNFIKNYTQVFRYDPDVNMMLRKFKFSTEKQNFNKGGEEDLKSKIESQEINELKLKYQQIINKLKQKENLLQSVIRSSKQSEKRQKQILEVERLKQQFKTKRYESQLKDNKKHSYIMHIIQFITTLILLFIQYKFIQNTNLKSAQEQRILRQKQRQEERLIRLKQKQDQRLIRQKQKQEQKRQEDQKLKQPYQNACSDAINVEIKPYFLNYYFQSVDKLVSQIDQKILYLQGSEGLGKTLVIKRVFLKKLKEQNNQVLYVSRQQHSSEKLIQMIRSISQQIQRKLKQQGKSKNKKFYIAIDRIDLFFSGRPQLKQQQLKYFTDFVKLMDSLPRKQCKIILITSNDFMESYIKSITGISRKFEFIGLQDLTKEQVMRYLQRVHQDPSRKGVMNKALMEEIANNHSTLKEVNTVADSYYSQKDASQENKIIKARKSSQQIIKKQEKYIFYALLHNPYKQDELFRILLNQCLKFQTNPSISIKDNRISNQVKYILELFRHLISKNIFTIGQFRTLSMLKGFQKLLNDDQLNYRQKFLNYPPGYLKNNKIKCGKLREEWN